MGSALTYAKRYSWAALCGIAAEEDDDANAAQGAIKNGSLRGRELVSPEQRDELIALADDVGADKGKFCAYMKVPSLADIQANQFDRAKAALEAKRAKA
jgi:hypothetical protein